MAENHHWRSKEDAFDDFDQLDDFYDPNIKSSWDMQSKLPIGTRGRGNKTCDSDTDEDDAEFDLSLSYNREDKQKIDANRELEVQKLLRNACGIGYSNRVIEEHWRKKTNVHAPESESKMDATPTFRGLQKNTDDFKNWNRYAKETETGGSSEKNFKIDQKSTARRTTYDFQPQRTTNRIHQDSSRSHDLHRHDVDVPSSCGRTNVEILGNRLSQGIRKDHNYYRSQSASSDENSRLHRKSMARGTTYEFQPKIVENRTTQGRHGLNRDDLNITSRSGRANVEMFGNKLSQDIRNDHNYYRSQSASSDENSRLHRKSMARETTYEYKRKIAANRNFQGSSGSYGLNRHDVDATSSCGGTTVEMLGKNISQDIRNDHNYYRSQSASSDENSRLHRKSMARGNTYEYKRKIAANRNLQGSAGAHGLNRHDVDATSSCGRTTVEMLGKKLSQELRKGHNYNRSQSASSDENIIVESYDIDDIDNKMQNMSIKNKETGKKPNRKKYKPLDVNIVLARPARAFNEYNKIPTKNYPFGDISKSSLNPNAQEFFFDHKHKSYEFPPL